MSQLDFYPYTNISIAQSAHQDLQVSHLFGKWLWHSYRSETLGHKDAYILPLAFETREAECNFIHLASEGDRP